MRELKTGTPVVEVRNLAKTFRLGFFRKRVEAVRDISFEVRPGEIFGLLGPNGAGKTTTIKALLGLIFPTRGETRLFGQKTGDRRSREKLGYMPENPYVYQYLRPLEFLDLCGRLMGISAQDRRARALAILDRVGLSHALDRPIGNFSKGMTQRVGLAQALLHDPELLILDEPMSGLDPIGRKEIRDLLLEQKQRGKTLMVTSHILSDMELLCDRVAIVRAGEVVASGSIETLLRPQVQSTEIVLRHAQTSLVDALSGLGHDIEVREDIVRVRVTEESAVAAVLRTALDAHAQIQAVTPHRESLEDLFVRNAVRGSD